MGKWEEKEKNQTLDETEDPILKRSIELAARTSKALNLYVYENYISFQQWKRNSTSYNADQCFI